MNTILDVIAWTAGAVGCLAVLSFVIAAACTAAES